MNKTYHELTITLDDTYLELVAEFITTLLGEGVELGKGKIIVRSESNLTLVKDALASFEGIHMSFSFEEKENQDWIKAYQDSIQPIEAGEFYIYPSWYAPKEGLVNIKIDPALAFGSGHHATTFSCLQAISRFVKPEDHVIDVGCGSGILGLAAKKRGAKVALCDTDPISVKSTKKNFTLNGETYDKIWEGSIDKVESRYDVVIANIIVDVLKFISKDLKEALNEGGYLILSGILDKKETSLSNAFEELTLVERILKDEWVTLIYKK
ncbi:MAG: 50S ribosomal protein L11 methyltransferase [Sulfurimonas sp.]